MPPPVQNDPHLFEALISIPGHPEGSGALVGVLRSEPAQPLVETLRGGFEGLVITTGDFPPPALQELGPLGRRDAGPDALLAAAAALRTRVNSAVGVAGPLPGGGFLVEVTRIQPSTVLTPGQVGEALGLDPEFIADTGRLPELVRVGAPVLVVPVEDRESVEETLPQTEPLGRLVPGEPPEWVALVIAGPEGNPLPDPLPVTVFRAGSWPRPVAASATAAAAVAGLDEILAPGVPHNLLFTPARTETDADTPLPAMTVTRTAHGVLTVQAGARRLY